MTTIKVWKSGVKSSKFDGRAEHIVVNEQWPAGRFALTEEQAVIWAQECADMVNNDPNSGATDWMPVVWQEDIEDRSKN